MSPSATNPTLTQKGSSVFNRLAFTDADQGKIAAGLLFDQLGFTKLALMHDGGSYGQGLADVVQAEFTSLGGEVTAYEALTPGEADYVAVLSAVADSEPEVVYFGGYAAEAIVMMNQWSQAGLDGVQFFGCDGTFGVEFTEKTGANGEGSIAASMVPEESSESFDEFTSDPNKPVPYTAPFLSARSFYNRQYLSEDQRFAATRPDVLVYKGEVIEKELTVAGPIEIELFVSTTGTDADWVVKLIDVFPDTADQRGLNQRDIVVGGYQMLVRGDIFRGKYRNSFEHPEPFIPDEVTRVKFTLPDLNHTFREGHRIMIQIQSSWFPLFDRNPQTFTNIYQCDEEAFQQATHRVFHSAKYPTNLKLPVLSR